MNRKQKETIINMLHARRKELKKEEEVVSALRDTTGELSLYDNHPGDSATELFDRTKDQALEERRQRELQAIERTLEKVEIGTFGYCEETKEPIPYERLLASPTAQTAKVSPPVTTKQNEYRPVEEDVMLDIDSIREHEDRTAFDGEDAWQAVANTHEEGFLDQSINIGFEEDQMGYVEELESFLSTDMYGYRGVGSVSVDKNDAFYRIVRETDGNSD